MAKILLVEDSSTVTKVVSLVLGKANHEIIPCSKPQDLQSKLESDIDLIIFDSELYDQDLHASINIPMLFTYTDYEAVAKKSSPKQAVAKLVKPFSSEQLLSAVDEALNKELKLENTWSMDSFKDPEISEIFSKNQDKGENMGEVDKKQDNNDSFDERTEVTDIVSKTLTDNILNDIYGFDEKSEVKHISDDDSVLSSIDDGELSKEEQEKLLEEYKLEQEPDGTIKFKDEDEEIKTDVSMETEQTHQEKEEENINDIKTELKEEETPITEPVEIDMDVLSSLDLDTDKDLESSTETKEEYSISENKDKIEKTATDINNETISEGIEKSMEKALKAVLPDVLRNLVKDEEFITNLRKSILDLAETLIKEEIRKINAE